jgi:CheY-like chemotaxis protein
MPLLVCEKILLVDDSRVYRELMSTLLRPHCRQLLLADSAASAIECIDAEPTLDLVVCDVVMKGDDGFVVLEHLRRLNRPATRAVMVTGFRSEDGARRAQDLGAAGYLQKPTTVRQILNAIQSHEDAERLDLHPRWRCNATATLLDLQTGQTGPLTWDVYNICPSGAFLESKGPIPLGSEIGLLLEVPGGKATLRARVVRVQEPSWLEVGGIGVEFIDADPQAEAVIANAIEGACR